MLLCRTITLVLLKKPELPSYVNNGEPTIAVRMATSKALENLIKETRSPIFMSSANLSGFPTCTNLEEIEKTFPNLDGLMEGDVFFGEASSIIDCTSETLKVLRQGPILIEQIIDVLEN